ncbi:uncharacterized protein SOCEGT47_075470 [Sorangium cellulosum]|uniref:Uncharacterized protein n=1 Tax=Sorangium cellulosum TaxID=56 RepID=A0A4P2QBD9_SORCE|nr:uncharacterized protein SOCEGT47_075470 [Sorangium cellulosum]
MEVLPGYPARGEGARVRMSPGPEQHERSHLAGQAFWPPGSELGGDGGGRLWGAHLRGLRSGEPLSWLACTSTPPVSSQRAAPPPGCWSCGCWRPTCRRRWRCSVHPPYSTRRPGTNVGEIEVLGVASGAVLMPRGAPDTPDALAAAQIALSRLGFRPRPALPAGSWAGCALVLASVSSAGEPPCNAEEPYQHVLAGDPRTPAQPGRDLDLAPGEGAPGDAGGGGAHGDPGEDRGAHEVRIAAGTK